MLDQFEELRMMRLPVARPHALNLGRERIIAGLIHFQSGLVIGDIIARKASIVEPVVYALNVCEVWICKVD